MAVRIKLIKDFKSEGKPLIVGLPGMGKVGYVSANFFVKEFNGELVAEVYSTYFPAQLVVGRDGVSTLFRGKIFDIGDALVFTADTQPPSPEGQNEVCEALLSFLNGELDVKPEKPGVRAIIAAAAFVVPQVGSLRRVFVAGNKDSIVKEFVKLGAEALNEGVITGINGAIVGWASLYDIPGVVVLGETWAPIVEFDETDYRAAKRVIEVIANYLNTKVDVSYMDGLANTVEGKVLTILKQAAPRRPAREERKEVL